ncbi:hypothetical protein HQ560_18650, partial [bacterium]|nr:hypothetical protein [bacterium]
MTGAAIRRFTLLASLLLLPTVALPGASIENAFLTVQVDPAAGSATIRSKRSPETFVVDARFARKTKAATSRPVAAPVWGKGSEIA